MLYRTSIKILDLENMAAKLINRNEKQSMGNPLREKRIKVADDMALGGPRKLCKELFIELVFQVQKNYSSLHQLWQKVLITGKN